MENSHDEYMALAFVLLICSVISVISSLIVVFFYLRYPRIRGEFLSTLIFLLALSDIFLWGTIIITSSYYINTTNDFSHSSSGGCIFLAFFHTFSSLFNNSMTLLITITLYLALIKNIDPVLHNRKMFISAFMDYYHRKLFCMDNIYERMEVRCL